MIDPQRIVALAILLTAAGMWLLLPRGRGGGKAAGAMLMSVALGLWVSRLPWLDTWFPSATLLLLGGVTIVSAIGAVSLANPVYCALWFGMTLLGTAGLFLFQGAQFLALATVIVYAGAILVTFLFVLMLARPDGRAYYDRTSWEALLSAAAGMIMVGMLTLSIFNALGARPPAPSLPIVAAADLQRGLLAPDHVARIGGELFGRHLLAVELAGVLLLAALVGASAIAGHARSATDVVRKGEAALLNDPDEQPTTEH
jgi:NADH-quinone oxidoreductase subunit J